MANTFQVDIVTPEKVAYKGEAASLVAPSEYGYLGILAHHTPLVAHLTKGFITIRDEKFSEKVFHLDGDGFLEVSNNKATLLVTNIGLR